MEINKVFGGKIWHVNEWLLFALEDDLVCLRKKQGSCQKYKANRLKKSTFQFQNLKDYFYIGINNFNIGVNNH